MSHWFFSVMALIGSQRDGSLARRGAFVGWMSAPMYFLLGLWALGGWLLAEHDAHLDGRMLGYATVYAFTLFLLWVAVALRGLYLDSKRLPDTLYTQVVLWGYAITAAITCYLVGTMNIVAGLIMMGAPLIGMMLFPVRQVLVVFGSSIVAVLLMSVASAAGYLPYAPILNSGLLVDTRPGLYYAMSGIAGAGLYVAYEVLIMMALVSAWHYREAGVRALSITDTLTGVANRRHIIDELERQLAIHERSNARIAVIMVDIDHFKQINDAHGHIAGDRALTAAAEALRACLRGSDLIGRYGGEEFLILLPGASLADAHDVAERCRQAVAATGVEANGVRVTLTASLGVTSQPATEVRNVDQLIHIADEAMYQAKQGGRNRVVAA